MIVDRRWANGGAGVCHTEAGAGRVCELGGAGCPVDHFAVARENVRLLADMLRRAYGEELPGGDAEIEETLEGLQT